MGRGQLGLTAINYQRKIERIERKEKKMRKSTFFLTLTLAVAIASGGAWAGSLTVPNTFVTGTPAVAGQVNANFTAAETAVTDNDARITTNAASIVNKQNRVNATCSTGSSIRVINSDGSVICEVDDGGTGGGDITAVTAGSGLSGGGVSGEVILNVATGGITATHLGPDSVGSSEIADGSIGAADINSSDVQRRVSSSCSVGSYIREINSNGTVVCGIDADTGDAYGGSITDHENRIAYLEGVITDLQEKLAYVSISNSTIHGLAGPHVIIEGANLHIRNGSTQTDSNNGVGNLIVGYNEADYADNTQRTGSHNLVVGREHEYTNFGGFVAGYRNMVVGPYASVSGGSGNIAIGPYASVSGGYANSATHLYASVTGGSYNVASLDYATVSGGSYNTASGSSASVSGGWANSASGPRSSVSGGYGNTASNLYATVSGGFHNSASGPRSSVSGGEMNGAIGMGSSVIGGHTNDAGGDYATVSGGSNNTASGYTASVSGGYFNTASGEAASVSGGYIRSATGQLDWVAGTLFETE